MLFSDLIKINIIVIIFIIIITIYIFLYVIFDENIDESVKKTVVSTTKRVFIYNINQKLEGIYIDFYYYLINKKFDLLKKLVHQDFIFTKSLIGNSVFIPLLLKVNAIYDDNLLNNQLIAEFISSVTNNINIIIREKWLFEIKNENLLIKSIT